jgi:hypothetical protein
MSNKWKRHKHCKCMANSIRSPNRWSVAVKAIPEGMDGPRQPTADPKDNVDQHMDQHVRTFCENTIFALFPLSMWFAYRHGEGRPGEGWTRRRRPQSLAVPSRRDHRNAFWHELMAAAADQGHRWSQKRAGNPVGGCRRLRRSAE